MFRSSQQTAAFENKYIFPARLQEDVFLLENFRVLCKCEAKAAMGAIERTAQEGSIPTWMEDVFVTTFF